MEPEKKQPTKSQKVATDIAFRIRARMPLFWVNSREEARVESWLFQAGAAAGLIGRTWDVAQGLCAIDGVPIQEETQALDSALSFILGEVKKAEDKSGNPDPALWILRDASPWLEGLSGAAPCRALRNLARRMPGVETNRMHAIVILTASGNIPAELSGHATVIEWPLPDRAEMSQILEAALDPYRKNEKVTIPTNGAFEASVDAAIGLIEEEAQACFAESLVKLKRIDPVAVASEKKRVISKDKLLEWVEPVIGGIDAIGGLDLMKGWLAERKMAYSPKARAYGLQPPKGFLLVGPPGTGKTMTAKAVSSAWELPLLRLDLGALKDKYVGSSEGKIRAVLRVIEAIGRCVVLVDEVEKALAGATQGAADGGVSADALGVLLSWMSDRTCPAFIVATSNDTSSLPPELTRAGRFDEVFCVDLPTRKERSDILLTALKANDREGIDVRPYDVSDVTEGFSGAEIASLVQKAMFAAFPDGGREIVTGDLIAAAKMTNPVSKSAADKINRLRAWAKANARPASLPEELAAARGPSVRIAAI